MKLDVGFVESVITLYNNLRFNGIYIVYIGKFTQRITSMFSQMLEEELDRRSEDRKTRRRLYHAMVETMQNIQRHAEQYTDEDFTNGLFMIGKKTGVYYIITVNKIMTEKEAQITAALEQVNNATIDELNQMYKKQLLEGEIGEKGGAGLGLIDIVRKTQNKLEYLFLPIDFNEKHFVLKAEIDPKKFTEEKCAEE